MIEERFLVNTHGLFGILIFAFSLSSFSHNFSKDQSRVYSLQDGRTATVRVKDPIYAWHDNSGVVVAARVLGFPDARGATALDTRIIVKPDDDQPHAKWPINRDDEFENGFIASIGGSAYLAKGVTRKIDGVETEIKMGASVILNNSKYVKESYTGSVRALDFTGRKFLVVNGENNFDIWGIEEMAFLDKDKALTYLSQELQSEYNSLQSAQRPNSQQPSSEHKSLKGQQVAYRLGTYYVIGDDGGSTIVLQFYVSDATWVPLTVPRNEVTVL